MLFPAELPPELVFHVLSYLSFRSLHVLQQLNREWRSFSKANEHYIYRNAAARHQFVSSISVALDDAVVASKQFLPDVEIADWRTFCRLRFCMEKKWTGRGDLRYQALSSDHPDVHRIKVDEERGLLITTHLDGGINVRDLGTDEILWALPRTYVRECAHCEYENGFLIFDRIGQAKEVWRLASAYESSPAPPEEFQQEMAFTINRYISPSKGHFKPWGVLSVPDWGRAFRFVYPTLAVVSAHSIFLFDIPTCQLVKTITDIQKAVDDCILGDICYVELSSQYVFICGSCQLRVFDRTSGSLVYSLSSTDNRIVERGITVHQKSDHLHTTRVAIAPLEVHEGHPNVSPLHGEEISFVAVHADKHSGGNAIVALLNDCRLVVIRDIREVIKNKKALEEQGMEIVVGCSKHHEENLEEPWAVYLAFEHGRIGLVTNSGIFVLTMDASKHGLVENSPLLLEAHSASTSNNTGASLPFPFVQAARLVPFVNEEPLCNVSCLQMTARRVLFAWDRRFLPRDHSLNPLLAEQLAQAGLSLQDVQKSIAAAGDAGQQIEFPFVGMNDAVNGELEEEDLEPGSIVLCADFTSYDAIEAPAA